MTPKQFIDKWKPVNLTERAAAQSHFRDLCELVGHQDPISMDPNGEFFTFEKGVPKSGGGDGWADVWKRGVFAWEYKKKKRSLGEAQKQLTLYASALQNPPLHIVCDTDIIRITTAWTNTIPKTYDISLDDLVDPAKLATLKAVFFDPELLRPTKTRAALTKEAADKFAKLAARLEANHSAEVVAHFINQLVFCYFADSIRLLPEGLFGRMLGYIRQRPARSEWALQKLFETMSKQDQELGFEPIPWFNGGVFDGRSPLAVDAEGVEILWSLFRTRDEHKREVPVDWSQIDPTILGTLFERFLDPAKRAQIGAHYTDFDNIILIVNTVIMHPLNKMWTTKKEEIKDLLNGIVKPPKREGSNSRMKPLEAAEEVRASFTQYLANLSILDPACGSGNFLYVALQAVKDLELRANLESETLGLKSQASLVGPEILSGLEINGIAAELARTTIWIGDIQWGVRNSIYTRPEPVLRKLNNIVRCDAILRPRKANGLPDWPSADFIIGNPPFLGGKNLRNGRRSKKRNSPGLGDAYVEELFEIYEGLVPREADLVVYWVALCEALQRAENPPRVGLVTTNSIRGGVNRTPLVALTKSGLIFEAWSDKEWVVDGADVRVSIVCFGPNNGDLRLNGKPVERINCDLTDYKTDLTKAKVLIQNTGVAFMGDTKGGPFEIPGSLARSWLKVSSNPNGKPNSDVLKPWAHGAEIADRPEDKWIIDFGWTMLEDEAAKYEHPFEYVMQFVKPKKSKNKREIYASAWWRHTESRQGMWSAVNKRSRYLATIRHSKFRSFKWFDKSVLPDSALVVVARDDDFCFGVLQSSYHEHWSLRLGTSVGVGNDPRYTPTTTFQTFPFPEGFTPDLQLSDYIQTPVAKRISQAAKELDEHRRRWLNPAALVREEREICDRYPLRQVAKDDAAGSELEKLTLTNLYNLRPSWLVNLHRDLDKAVAAAYGWPEDIGIEDALERLLELNHARSGVSVNVAEEEEVEDPDTGERLEEG